MSSNSPTMQDSELPTAKIHVPRMQKQKCERKSRAGCRNCKLRKLKCDETRPQCKRCSTYGVLCNIKFNVPDFQPCTEESARQVIRRDKLEGPRLPICSAVWTASASISFTMDAKCQNLIKSFKSQSVFSGDDTMWMKSKNKLVDLAFTHPFLMHGILALAAVHERYLSPWAYVRRPPRELYHWSQCTTLFNKRLSLPIEPQDRDAIWGTAFTLSHITFSSLDATTSEESWPLKPPDPSDLEWMRLGHGKMAVWHTTDPLRPDSLFNVMASSLAQINSPLQATGIDGVPIALAQLCNLGESSTAEKSPYFLVVHVVAHLYCLPDDQLVTGKVLSFIRQMPPSFKSLLQKKDHVALLILYLWYCRARRATWWIELRARVECPAICVYLRRYHKGNVAIEAFLPREQSRKGEGY